MRPFRKVATSRSGEALQVSEAGNQHEVFASLAGSCCLGRTTLPTRSTLLMNYTCRNCKQTHSAM